MYKSVVLITALLFSAVAGAEEASYGLTPSPVIGYDPTFGWLLGAALFIYPDSKGKDDPADRYFDILAVHVDSPAWMLRSNFQQLNLFFHTDFSLEAVYSGFYQPWFGEGDNTPADPLYRIEQQFLKLRPALSFPLTEALAWSLFADYRRRTEHGVDGDPSLRLFPDETTTALGVGLRSDSRPDRFSPTSGHLAELLLSWSSPGMSSLDGADTVWQLQGQWRQYVALSGTITWAGRVAAGISEGEPGYLFRYTLGGAAMLRGLEGNRLRGKRYWLLQNELRYPLWRTISGTAFVESGDVGEQSFGAPLTTYGIGMRFGLPPDFRVKLRLDFARTEGEETLVYLDFGHAF